MEDDTRLIAFGIMGTFVIVVFLFLFLYATSLVGDSLNANIVSSTGISGSETLLTGSAITNTLSQSPTSSLLVKSLNLTWLDFNNSARVHINENINYSLPYSVSFWMKKPSAVDGSAGYIVCKADSTGNQRAFQFHTNTGNDLLYLSYPNGTSTNITTSQWNNFLTVDTWYHIVGVSNTTELRLYGNGLQVDNDTIVSDPQKGKVTFDGTANVTMGNCQFNAGFYNGSIDDVRLYNRALSYSEINDLYLIGRTIDIPSDSIKGYYEDFSSYSVGNDTTKPNWIPQYSGYINITSDSKLQLNYITQQGGDRDLHIQLNRSEISNGIQNITATFQFNVTECNQTFKLSEGISNIGASTYLWYYDGNNFLSAEIKTNATTSNCGSGDQGQFTIYKRVAGTTTALNTQTLWNFSMGKIYNVSLIFTKYNTTTYNYSVSILGSPDGIIQRSSTNLTIGEVFDGQFLLENAGAVTLFDNVNVSRPQYIVQATDQYRLNENQGTIVYDFLGLSNGTLGNGATYNNDTILTTLVSSDYNQTGSSFILNNNDFSFSKLYLTYSYGQVIIEDDYVRNSIVGISSYIAIFIGILGLILVLSIIVYLVSSVNKIREFFS